MSITDYRETNRVEFKELVHVDAIKNYNTILVRLRLSSEQ